MGVIITTIATAIAIGRMQRRGLGVEEGGGWVGKVDWDF